MEEMPDLTTSVSIQYYIYEKTTLSPMHLATNTSSNLWYGCVHYRAVQLVNLGGYQRLRGFIIWWRVILNVPEMLHITLKITGYLEEQLQP